MKISCIIPAYNEEERISAVLRVVTKHPLIDEVIVVDDCSKDKTYNEAKKFNSVKIIRNKQNKGKTFSLMEGIKKARNQMIMTLDSDLGNLTKQNITDLIMPIIQKKAEVTIVRFHHLIFRIIGADSGSGQRIFNKKIISLKDLKKLKGYGFESYLNEIIIHNKMKIKNIYWPDVTTPEKSYKLGKRGIARIYFCIKGCLSMWIEMIKTAGFFNFFIQPFQLARLDVD